jgi:hypothetical protein
VRRPAFVLGLALLAAPVHADLTALRNLAGKAVEEYRRIQEQAQVTARRERGDGNCGERAGRLVERAGEAVRLARLSNDIYDHPYALQMKAAGQTKTSFRGADGRTVVAHWDALSEGYAEEYAGDEDAPITVVFRGTRLQSMKDLTANVIQFSDVVPTKYRWAAALVDDVVARHAGRPVVVAGHSLGGGLAMYAALRTPVRAVAFNPAGLSRASLGGLSVPQLRAVQERTIAFVARSGTVIEPVSALSLAGESAIVGRRYLIDVGAVPTPLRQHDMSRLAQSLADLAARATAIRPESICADDLGYQRL